MPEVIIYALRDPETLQVRIVGATGNTPEQRRNEHVTEAFYGERPSNKDKCDWIRDLWPHQPIVSVLAESSLETWQEDERYWISVLGGCSDEGGTLLNIRPGGEGTIKGSLSGIDHYVYLGMQFVSLSDANWASWFSSLKLAWRYEPDGRFVVGEIVPVVCGSRYALREYDGEFAVELEPVGDPNRFFAWRVWRGGEFSPPLSIVPGYGFCQVNDLRPDAIRSGEYRSVRAPCKVVRRER